MKVCVVGGAGYIGSETVYELIRNGHEVVVIDNLSTGKKEMVHKSAKFYLGDITKEEDLKHIFEQECMIKHFDVVMHFAAKLIVPESVEKPLEYYHNNVEGLRILLSVMNDFNIKNIVFSSTAAVYGEPNKDICEESDLTKPINPYGETKLVCENMIKWVCQRYDMHYCIFRYFNVAGADETLEIGLDKSNLTHIVPITVETALGLREKMTVFGNDYNTKDGTCIRDYIHVQDLAYAHVLGAQYIFENEENLLLNLGSNNGYTVLEIIKEVEKYYKVNYEIGKRRAGDPAKIVASNKKACEKLGWKPKRTLSDIIKSDLDYRMKLNKK